MSKCASGFFCARFGFEKSLKIGRFAWNSVKILRIFLDFSKKFKKNAIFLIYYFDFFLKTHRSNIISSNLIKFRRKRILGTELARKYVSKNAHLKISKPSLRRTVMKKDKSVLAMYLNEINKIPLLGHDEENVLAVRAKSGDKAAREKIVNANLRFVVNVAKKYQNLGLAFEDLIGEGNVGLLTAIDKFDASKGYHFISYAVWWIRQSILKAIYEKRSAIRLPLNRVAELTKIQATKKMVGSEKSEEQKIAAIASSLGMEEEHVRELLNISREMISLDMKVRADKNEVSTVGDFMEDERYESPETVSVNNSMKSEIDTVLDTLRPNEARVLRMRYGLNGYRPMSLKEVGDACSLTKERIRQIEKHAIERMRMPVRRKRLDVYMAA